MKEVGKKNFEVHAFVCTNDKGAGKASCNPVGGQEFFARLKASMKAAGVWGTHRVTRTGCLSHCNAVGCTVAIYRAGQPSDWFTEVKPQDFDRIWREIVGESIPIPELPDEDKT